MACNDRCFHKILQRISHSEQPVFASLSHEIKGILVADTAFWINLDFVWRCGILSFCQLWPAFALVSDRLGEKVSVNVKMPKKMFWRNWIILFCILYCGQWNATWNHFILKILNILQCCGLTETATGLCLPHWFLANFTCLYSAPNFLT